MAACSYVYILASRKNGTLYVGVTTNLLRRTFEHKDNLVQGFTQKYNVHVLVHYEIFEIVTDAIKREKLLKRWKREWKLNLIEKHNPRWRDLYDDLVGE